ncbi:gypsy type transposase [Tanacetum coccineum]
MVDSLYKKALSAFLRSRIAVMLVRMVIDKFGIAGIKNAWYDASQVTDSILETYTRPLRTKGWDRALLEFTAEMVASSVPESNPSLTERLNEISCPAVLIVTGDSDRLVPSWNSVRLSQAIPGSRLYNKPLDHDGSNISISWRGSTKSCCSLGGSNTLLSGSALTNLSQTVLRYQTLCIVAIQESTLKAFNVYIKDRRTAEKVRELEISSAGLQEKITVYDNCMEQLEKFQDDRMKVVNDKLAKLDADLAKMACHLEERFYSYLLNTISGRRWLLTHGLKIFLVKCLNSSKYLMALGVAISHAIEKGMQSGLAAVIDHGREGRSLADVAAYNPGDEANFNSAL